MSRYEELAEKLNECKRVAVLTGAGISAESGIPTFREADGMWSKFNPGELASMEGFQRDPVLVWKWYNDRRVNMSDKKPNKGHEALVGFQDYFNDVVIITQNVDGFHHVAGSKEVIELHGNIWEFKCLSEDTVVSNRDVPIESIPPKCECGSLYRPNVVWFGEMLPQDALRRAFKEAEQCDVFFVVGTSAMVQPAASLPLIALQGRKTVIEVNPEKTPLSDLVTYSFHESASETLPKILTHLQH